MVERVSWSHIVARFLEKGIILGFHRRGSALPPTLFKDRLSNRKGLRCLSDLCQPKDNSLVWDGSLSVTPSCLYPSHGLLPCFEVLVRTGWRWNSSLDLSFSMFYNSRPTGFVLLQGFPLGSVRSSDPVHLNSTHFNGPRFLVQKMLLL